MTRSRHPIIAVCIWSAVAFAALGMGWGTGPVTVHNIASHHGAGQ